MADGFGQLAFEVFALVQQWFGDSKIVDEDGNPSPVPALIPETEEQRQRMGEGKARQLYRLSQRRVQALNESDESKNNG